MASQPPSGFPSIPNPGDIANNVLDAIPGEGWILDIVKAVADLPGILLTLIQEAEQQHPIAILEALVEHVGTGLSLLKSDRANIWEWVTAHSVGEFYTWMLKTGLEVDPDYFDDNAAQGLKVVDSMLGFAFILQFAVAAMEGVGEGILGGRFTGALAHTLAKIPEELGISWVLGTAIEQGFETAVGESIREGINRQKRGNRVAWQQLRVLLKQHILTEDQLIDLLKNQGFPDEQIAWLQKLADVTIPVGDIAQLYYRETIDEDQARELIKELGFNERDAAHVLELYVTKAETQASVTYRSIAKNMYINHLLSEDQYRAILTESNFPKRMIDADIAGITLEQSTGHLLETVALVKSEYLHKQIDPSEARRRLALLNYAPSYITELIASWDQPTIKAKHGLSTAKVLSYMISGLITPDQARPMLQSNGVDDTTVDFLLLHPTANTGAKQHALSPGLVTQAYMDGAITLAELPTIYKKAGVADNNLNYYVNIAKYKFSHKRGNPGYTQTVTAGEWRQAYKVGLIDFATLVQELESVGYPPDAAMLLAEIENKGPYQPPQPPAFASLSDALAYIQAAGYVLTNPTDPRLLAAENMAAIAGYTWTKSTGAGGIGFGSGGTPSSGGPPIPAPGGIPNPGPIPPPGPVPNPTG